ncbi:non-specific lipid transfer protein GPI-anchored 5-like [Magnolia sinica]|uniref:non-specific lipid transfer protein GPI-anchored 5-like n=1 Tax=Magnolia sinica TaxID=86752 RepID=UPI002657C73A|nr:non-specific lipid transfer protein GPI-anchored 5-like [Magnolia sinica]
MHCREREKREMEASMKCLCFFGLILIVGVAVIDAAGECGKSSTENEAYKLAPCMSAAQDGNAVVSDKCCLQVKRMGQNPSCLCAVLLSNTAKSAGVKPDVAITIPKRCNLADRPVGLKCGAYTLP